MATDQEIRDAGFKYIPQQKYLQNPFQIPIAPVPPVVNEGIVNTNAFVNSGGGGEIRYDNSFLPDPPTFNYVDTVAMYGADSPQAQKMLEKAGGTYPGGNYMTEGGFEFTNSFPDTSVQMQDLNYNPNVSSTGNVLSNYNRMDGYLDEGSQITGNTVGVGTGSPITNINGLPSIMSSPGVRTIKGDLSTIANPEIFDSYGTSVKDPQVGDVGFENYSESAFNEEDDKKSFISNMISRAKQIGSDLPAWAKAAATAIGGPLSVAANLIGIGTSNTSPSYQQFNPAGTFTGGIYSIDGVNYGNMSMVNDFYDNNPESDTYGTDRFGRAKKGSFASFRTLKDYLDSKKNNDGDSDNDNDKDKDTPGFSAPTQQGQSPKGSTTGGDGEGGTGGTGGTGGVGGANDGNPGANTSNQGYSQHHAKGGRVGYFYGGRVNFKYGGLASIL